MITGSYILDAPDKKRILKDPRAWVQEHHIRVGKRALSELLAQRDTMKAQQSDLKLASRQLSSAIGQAKKQGAPFAELLEEKRQISAREKQDLRAMAELETQLLTLIDSGSPKNDAPNEAASDATFSGSQEEIDVAAVTVEELERGSESQWDEFVEAHSEGTVYHLAAIKGIIEQIYGHEAVYLVARLHGRIVGVLPLVRLKSRLFGDFMVSQPFFNYGGVLALSDAIAALLLENASDLALKKGCDHVEFRHCRALVDMPVRTDKVVMWLELPDSQEQLWQSVGSKVRAQVKRATRFGLEAQCGGAELLDDFYRVFAINMRDLGTPVYSKSFFRVLLESPLPDMRLVVVRHNGKPVSGAFLMGYKGHIEVPWASTLRRANRYDANMFLYWELLCQACSSGYKVFDFGRSTLDAPTYRFKKQWGAQPKQLYWHYWLKEGGEPPKISPDNRKYQLAIAAWQRLPVWLTRVIGPPIVKYLP